MHIYHFAPTKDRVWASRPVTWTLNERGNLICSVGGQNYEAVRHRTDYGWCWFELFDNGRNTHRQFADPPACMDGYVGVSAALADPCPCGCTAGLAAQLDVAVASCPAS
jgi:hypothetical protein